MENQGIWQAIINGDVVHEAYSLGELQSKREKYLAFENFIPVDELVLSYQDIDLPCSEKVVGRFNSRVESNTIFINNL